MITEALATEQTMDLPGEGVLTPQCVSQPHFCWGLEVFSLGSEMNTHRHSINNKRTKRSGVQWTLRSNFNFDTSWPKQSQPRHLKLRNGSQASKHKAFYRAQGTECPHTNQGVLCCVLSKYWGRNSLKYNKLGIFLKILGLLVSRAPKYVVTHNKPRGTHGVRHLLNPQPECTTQCDRYLNEHQEYRWTGFLCIQYYYFSRSNE